ncbi:hypothetical protein KVA01_08270 [Kocuria varians]|uniref:EamA domain-containing protein n=1 Tax=Kocuria varians TaxID=1272 RepID=A0A4Y4D2T6_KOCVA|nr:EamA family transporter [Kocuria varians]GEC98672.1 hypothetical protein KVA01_08270 [Kocuria varians]
MPARNAADDDSPAPATAPARGTGHRITRREVLTATALVFVGSGCIQLSSAISSTLFASYGTAGTSGLRMLIAAALLLVLVLVRPRLRGRTRGEWLGIVVYGGAMAAMNQSLYAAIDRLPLGVAVTLEFLGPCAVALMASRKVKEGACALLSLGGVALISAGPTGYSDLAGYVAGLLAATFFGLYTLFAAKVGKAGGGLDGVALSVTVAALATLPFAAPLLPTVHGTDWALLAVAAVIGVAVPYSVDTVAGRITSARVIGVLFAFDPALGAVVGYAALGQDLSHAALAGIVLVVVAGGLLVWFSGEDAPDTATGQPGGVDLGAAAAAADLPGDDAAQSPSLPPAPPV